MKPTFATKVTDSACKWMSPQYTIDCFADISTQETCTVTQKLDLDQMSAERRIRIRKDTNIIKLIFCSFSYDTFFFFFKLGDVYRFISFRLMSKTKIDKLFKQ